MKYCIEQTENGWLWKRAGESVGLARHFNTIERAIAFLIKSSGADAIIIQQLVDLREGSKVERIQEDG